MKIIWAFAVLLAILVGVLLYLNPKDLTGRLSSGQPDNIESCFKVKLPASANLVKRIVEVGDTQKVWYQFNCNENFYQQLLSHSEQIGSMDEQRNRAVHAFTTYDVEFPPAGPDGCNANFVAVASYSAAMFFSSKDQQATILIDGY